MCWLLYHTRNYSVGVSRKVTLVLLPLGDPVELPVSGRSYMNNFAAARGGADDRSGGAAAAAVLALIRKSADALLASHKNAEGHPRPSFLPSLPSGFVPPLSLRILHTMEFRCGKESGRASLAAQVPLSRQPQDRLASTNWAENDCLMF